MESVAQRQTGTASSGATPRRVSVRETKVTGWDRVFAHKEETFGAAGTLGRASERDAFGVGER